MFLVHWIVDWLIGALALWLVAQIIPGIQIRSFQTAMLATIVIALVDVTIGPILRFIAFPITFLTLGLFRLVFNAVLLKLASIFTPGFRIDGFLNALLGSLVLTHRGYRLAARGVGYSINVLAPSNSAELAEALREAAAAGRTISLAGNSTKRQMAGPVEPADVAVTTVSLRGVLQYEPRDLTISVEAGVSWCEFTQLLAENRQMMPLDPPFADGATVGGVIAANCSGPRRRLYGTARDLVIGMKFATLEGKLVQSGGMVVKNVAGLDMAKLMIGSFGTLAAIAVVNFKLLPMPEVERSFLLPFDSAAAAIAARDVILKGQLQPAAIDLLNPAAARTLGNSRWLLALRAGGNAAAVERYEQRIRRFHGCAGIRSTSASRRCGAMWRTSRRNSWRRTRMARWSALRVP